MHPTGHHDTFPLFAPLPSGTPFILLPEKTVFQLDGQTAALHRAVSEIRQAIDAHGDTSAYGVMRPGADLPLFGHESDYDEQRRLHPDVSVEVIGQHHQGAHTETCVAFNVYLAWRADEERLPLLMLQEQLWATSDPADLNMYASDLDLTALQARTLSKLQDRFGPTGPRDADLHDWQLAQQQAYYQTKVDVPAHLSLDEAEEAAERVGALTYGQTLNLGQDISAHALNGGYWLLNVQGRLCGLYRNTRVLQTLTRPESQDVLQATHVDTAHFPKENLPSFQKVTLGQGAEYLIELMTDHTHQLVWNTKKPGRTWTLSDSAAQALRAARVEQLQTFGWDVH